MTEFGFKMFVQEQNRTILRAASLKKSINAAFDFEKCNYAYSGTG